jgi:hypothetical protein
VTLDDRGRIDVLNNNAGMSLLCSDDARELNGSVISVDRCWSAGAMTSNMLYLGAAGQLVG